MNYKMFDVIIIGGGHAGLEAAAAAARMGCSVALCTLDKNKIGWMPCNPAVGGIGKGHLVFEISALGGIMPKLCTESYLQANMLNRSKGPAVQGLRLQIDKIAYVHAASSMMKSYPNVTIIEGMVDAFTKSDQETLSGIIMKDGTLYQAKAVVVTTGTFLNGLVHMGRVNFAAGRQDEPSVTGLAAAIKNLDLTMGRLKTGTPPRLAKSTINFAVMEEQRSHDLPFLFEFNSHKVFHRASCFITRTNLKTHQTILDHAHLSPIYRGEIKGTAPRYCPSIEDKISRFKHKDSHHIFVEPESLSLDEVYPNGMSTSLPLEVQEQFIRTIVGFEDAKIVRPGYAIEYDFVLPNQLDHTLKVKNFKGLYFAGQINGTTGYEEAAAQGIIAGINAACFVQNREPFILHRQESYIGVMIDDLVTFGVDEPYRMFTSRAERRLLLRQDNAFYRLYKKARQYDLISDFLYEKIDLEYVGVQEHWKEIFKNKKDMVEVARLLSEGQDTQVKADFIPKEINPRQAEYLYAELLYEPYQEREKREIEKASEFRNLVIPSEFIYKELPGLSIELQQKLEKYRPTTIAQASLIQGMTPAALSLLIFNLRKLINS